MEKKQNQLYFIHNKKIRKMKIISYTRGLVLLTILYFDYVYLSKKVVVWGKTMAAHGRTMNAMHCTKIYATYESVARWQKFRNIHMQITNARA